MIRVATNDDIPALIALGKELHQSSDHARHPFVEEKVVALLESLIAGQGVVFIAELNGEVVGGFAGGLTEIWYSDSVVAFDYSIFIRPERRHGITAIRLIRAFEVWATEMGAKEIHLGITTGIRVLGTEQLYESQGFEYVGPMFCKEVSHGC